MPLLTFHNRHVYGALTGLGSLLVSSCAHIQPQDTQLQTKKLSVDFEELKTETFVALLEDFTNANLVAQTDTKSTLMVMREPWNKVSDAMMQANGLGAYVGDKLTVIAPLEKIKQLSRDQIRPNSALTVNKFPTNILFYCKDNDKNPLAIYHQGNELKPYNQVFFQIDGKNNFYHLFTEIGNNIPTLINNNHVIQANFKRGKFMMHDLRQPSNSLVHTDTFKCDFSQPYVDNVKSYSQLKLIKDFSIYETAKGFDIVIRFNGNPVSPKGFYQKNKKLTLDFYNVGYNKENLKDISVKGVTVQAQELNSVLRFDISLPAKPYYFYEKTNLDNLEIIVTTQKKR